MAVAMQIGDVADAILVRPPAGFVAESDRLEVGKDQTGRVEVRCRPTS